MHVLFHKQFKKDLERLPKKVRAQFSERLDLFLKNPTHPTLNNHALNGVPFHRRSINITGDYRAIFEETKEMYIFKMIGTHSELY